MSPRMPTTRLKRPTVMPSLYTAAEFPARIGTASPSSTARRPFTSNAVTLRVWRLNSNPITVVPDPVPCRVVAIPPHWPFAKGCLIIPGHPRGQPDTRSEAVP